MARPLVDLHAHVLWGLDDGPADRAGSAELLAALAAQGVATVVATPHVHERWHVDGAAIAAAMEGIAGLPGPTVLPGAEVSASRLDDVLQADPSAYALGSSDVMLVEVDAGATPDMLELVSRRVAHAGLRTLFAHPERCSALQRRPQLAEQLVRSGALLQLTASAVAGRAKSPSARLANELLERGLVHVVASDAHAPGRRLEAVGTARASLAAAGGEALADLLMGENPASLLAGGDVEPGRPRVVARPRRLGRLLRNPRR